MELRFSSNNRRNWGEVSPSNPCPICKHSSWCRVTEDRSLCACRRSDAGGEARTDKVGTPFWFYRLTPSANGEAWPPPQYSLSDCPKDEQGNPIAAEIDVRHKIYSRLLSCLPLRRLHVEDLERRGVKEGHREAGYRTLGRERAEATYQLVKGGMEQHLPSVPGFYVAEKDGRRYWSLAGLGGLLIPIRDAQGRIQSLAVRLDNPPKDGGKYRALSSKKRGGAGPGSPVHVPLFEGDKTIVRVTEGALKADIATRLSGTLTIGLPGVATWRRAGRVLNEIGAKVARVAFDADARRKRIVARSLSHLIGHLRGKGFAVELELWKEEDGKGIDDLLASGKEPEVLTDAAAIDATVAEIQTEAEKTDPTPSGLADGQVNEDFDDPHLLAREYRNRYQSGGIATMYFHRQTYCRWDGAAYRMLNEKEVRAEATQAIKAHFDRHNLHQIAMWRIKGGEGQPPTAPKVSTKTVGNVIQALSGIALLPGSIEPPAWIGDCENGWGAADMLACKNALVHLPSFVEGKQPWSIPPTPRFFSPNAVSYDFNPSAPKPLAWLAFLELLWSKDPEAIAALQEWFGYVLLPDTSQQKILMLIGPKRSGKGTIARVLSHLVGLHNVASPTLGSLGLPFGLQSLLNKSLAIVSDARLSGRTDTAIVVERLLSISGEDAQTIDRKYLESLTLKLPVRFMILTNELPKLNDPSGALVGRMVLLRMTETFYGKEDINLTATLLRELPGILLWGIEGWKRLRKRGHFIQPSSGTSIVQAMEDLSSPIHAFIREDCETGPGFNAICSELFEQWKSWCEPKGHKPGTDQTFGRDLRAAVPGLGTKQQRFGGVPLRVYTGIRVRPCSAGTPVPMAQGTDPFAD